MLVLVSMHLIISITMLKFYHPAVQFIIDFTEFGRIC